VADLFRGVHRCLVKGGQFLAFEETDLESRHLHLLGSRLFGLEVDHKVFPMDPLMKGEGEDDDANTIQIVRTSAVGRRRSPGSLIASGNTRAIEDELAVVTDALNLVHLITATKIETNLSTLSGVYDGIHGRNREREWRCEEQEVRDGWARMSMEQRNGKLAEDGVAEGGADSGMGVLSEIDRDASITARIALDLPLQKPRKRRAAFSNRLHDVLADEYR